MTPTFQPSPSRREEFWVEVVRAMDALDWIGVLAAVAAVRIVILILAM